MEGSLGRWRRVLTAIVGIVVVVALVAAAVTLVTGRAPESITIAAGAPGGAYHAFSERLRSAVADRGFTMHLLDTNGSVDNVQAIQTGSADIALVQSGTEDLVDVSGFTAISELFYEPIWVWYRTDRFGRLGSLDELDGHRVGIGVPGSGTYAVARRLLGLAGADGATQVEANATDTAELLRTGALDAGFVIAAADAPVVATLAQEPGVALFEYPDAEAYSRRLPYLSAVPIAKGVLDLRRSIPPQDGTMLAARATLVGEPGIHPDIARLLVTVLPEALGYPLIGSPAAFPSLAMTRFPVNDDARRYLEDGPTPLEQVLPFWIASPLARYYVVLLPLLVLLWPAYQIAKALYGWYMNSRIVSWYPRLHAIERGLPESTLPQLRLQRRFLAAVTARLTAKPRVSAGYMGAYYELRGHVAWVERRVDARIAALEADLTPEERAADTAEDAPPADPLAVDPATFSDVAMGIDDDLRELRQGPPDELDSPER